VLKYFHTADACCVELTIAAVRIAITIETTIVTCTALVTVLIRCIAMPMSLVFVATFGVFTVDHAAGNAQHGGATDCNCEPENYVHGEYLLSRPQSSLVIAMRFGCRSEGIIPVGLTSILTPADKWLVALIA
jgi:hypothetical protein